MTAIRAQARASIRKPVPVRCCVGSKSGSPVKMTLPNRAGLTYTYDSYQNMARTVRPEGSYSLFARDA